MLVAVGLEVLVAVGIAVFVTVALGVLVADGAEVLVAVGAVVLVAVALGVLVLLGTVVAAGPGVLVAVGTGAAPHRLSKTLHWVESAKDSGSTIMSAMPPLVPVVMAYFKSVAETVVPEAPHNPTSKIERPAPILARYWAMLLEYLGE